MKAIDTNILVRFVTRDDPARAKSADRIMATPVFLPLTVLLELAWVLGGRTYRFDRPMLASTLTTLIELRTLTVPHKEEVRWAIERFRAGADIGDMIHLVAARGAISFLSFDEALVGKSMMGSPLPVELAD